MLDAGAVAFLGIGRSAPLVARVGLWDAAPPPDVFPSGTAQPGKLSRLRHAAHADGALRLCCGVSASARLAIPAAAAVDAAVAVDASARLSLSAGAEVTAATAIAATADVRDVVLEILLLVD